MGRPVGSKHDPSLARENRFIATKLTPLSPPYDEIGAIVARARDLIAMRWNALAWTIAKNIEIKRHGPQASKQKHLFVSGALPAFLPPAPRAQELTECYRIHQVSVPHPVLSGPVFQSYNGGMVSMTSIRTRQEIEQSAYRRTIKKVEKMVLERDIENLRQRLSPCAQTAQRFEKKKWLEAERAVELSTRLDMVDVVEMLGRVYADHPHQSTLRERALVEASRAAHPNIVSHVLTWPNPDAKVMARCLEIASRQYDQEIIGLLVSHVDCCQDVLKAMCASRLMEEDDGYGAQACLRQCFDRIITQVPHGQMVTLADSLSAHSDWAAAHARQVQAEMEARRLQADTPRLQKRRTAPRL